MPFAQFSIGLVFFLNCINTLFTKKLDLSFSIFVRSAADILPQVITCILTSAMHSCVCCAEIPNF